MSRAAAVVVALLMTAGVLAAHPAAAVDEVAVTVTVLAYQEVDCPDDTLVPCPGDYYAKVAIGPHDFVSTPKGRTDTATAAPHWRVTQTVDRDAARFLPVRIELWDDDEDGVNPDDMMDVSDDGAGGPSTTGNDDRTLDLTLDLVVGDWGGEAGVDGTWAQGGTGPRARLLFDISMSASGDVDADGIPDGVERLGIRRITDGSLVADLSRFGTPAPGRSDPCRKTILLELDFMTGAADGHSHAPKDAALTEVTRAFADAPVPASSPCPYAAFGFGGTGGVQLLVERGNALPEVPVFTLDDLVTARGNAANFAPERRPYVHYGVFAHDQAAGSSSSGLCCRDGKDFLVTLGSWRTGCVGSGADGILQTAAAGDDVAAGGAISNGADRTCNSTATADDAQIAAVGGGAADHAVGTTRDQSGTVMHELGHALGLEHRGRDDVNHTPNYLSNMNYHFQQGIQRAGAPGSVLDYSRSVLPTLTEAALDENSGVGGPSTLLTQWFDGSGVLRAGNAGGALDWDQDGVLGTAVRVDLNNDSACISAGPDGALGTTPGGDDAVANGVVHNGANDRCETAPAGDDVRVTRGAAGTPVNGICVGTGPDEAMASTAAGDDRRFTNKITAGPDQVCQSTAVGDDVQVVPLNVSEPPVHPGWDDWSNIRYRAVLSRSAAGAGAGHEDGELDYTSVVSTETRLQQLMDPDLEARKTVDRADARPGDELRYTVTARNSGTGDATAVRVVDTLPNGSVTSTPLADVLPGRSRTAPFTYTVPCDTADGAVLVNRATVTARDLQGGAETDTSDNSASASTTVHAPDMTLDKTATSPVRAGEAITYRLTYANAGSGVAEDVVVTDTLPAGVYYSTGLDLGDGPRPSSTSVTPDGRTRLRWAVGTVAASSLPRVLEFTARPGLLELGGTVHANDAAVTFTANGCVYPPVTATATTSISTATPTRDPLTIGYWRTHPERWSAETLARVQATDQRFDGADGSTPDGTLSLTEVDAVLQPAAAASAVLRQQLLAVYANLAERRINAGTRISSRLATRLGLTDVRTAALYAVETLGLPAGENRSRYSGATDVLDEINTGRSPVY